MMRKYCRLYFVITIIFILIPFVSGENLFFVFYPCLICGMIPVNLLSYDESSHWTQYCETFPYTRAQTVSSKYLIGVLCQLTVILLTTASLAIRMQMNGGLRLHDLLTISLAMLAISSVSSAVCLPFIFRLGVEKGRAAYYVMIGVACAGSVLASNIFGAQAEISFRADLLFAILACSSIGIYALSWYLSIVFYRKREF